MAAPTGDSNEDLSGECDVFKEHFKNYKRKKPLPDLSNVLDFNDPSAIHMVKQVSRCDVIDPKLPPLQGLLHAQKWQVYSVTSLPGFYFIRNPFISRHQKYWIKRCLSDYPNKPNICNLDAHLELSHKDNIWDVGNRQKQQIPSEKTLLDKLRWVTLGYHYDWNTKKYRPESCSLFPLDLAYLSLYVAESLGFHDFAAEASIVNYYHMDSTLSGHTDHSEFDQQAPLVSVSFGQTAVFLVGGPTKATAPVAMYLRSGDITVMSGPCRLAYHAVPRVLPAAAAEMRECGLFPEEEGDGDGCHEGHGTQEDGGENAVSPRTAEPQEDDNKGSCNISPTVAEGNDDAPPCDNGMMADGAESGVQLTARDQTKELSTEGNQECQHLDFCDAWNGSDDVDHDYYLSSPVSDPGVFPSMLSSTLRLISEHGKCPRPHSLHELASHGGPWAPGTESREASPVTKDCVSQINPPSVGSSPQSEHTQLLKEPHTKHLVDISPLSDTASPLSEAKTPLSVGNSPLSQAKNLVDEDPYAVEENNDADPDLGSKLYVEQSLSEIGSSPIELDDQLHRSESSGAKISHVKTELVDHISSINEDIQQTLQNTAWQPYLHYVQAARINMNVRQVFQPGCGFPASECSNDLG